MIQRKRVSFRIRDLFFSLFHVQFFVCATSVPPVLDIIKEQDAVANCKWFKLDNSVYKKDPTKKSNKQSKKMDQLFWIAGTICFENFFDGLKYAEPKSVQRSKQVHLKRSMILCIIQWCGGVLGSLRDCIIQCCCCVLGALRRCFIGSSDNENSRTWS